MICFGSRDVRAGVLFALLMAGGAYPAAADPYADVQTLLEAGRLRDARDAALELTGANAADCPAWKLLGDAHRRLTRLDLAIAAYRKGLESCPEDKVLLRTLGLVYDEAENYDETVNILSRLWALDSSDPLIGSRLGAACYRAGRCTEGRKAYERLLQAHPNRTSDRTAYAHLLARSCRDYAAAEAEYRTLLAQVPGDASVHCALASLLAEAGRIEDAVKAAEAGIAAVAENAGCLYAAWGRALEAGADSLMAKGQVAQAISLYEQALAPLSKGMSDPVFGSHCKIVMDEVRYKRAPMEELTP
jgi:tetratricopeptide (TPR) repeat protein